MTLPAHPVIFNPFYCSVYTVASPLHNRIAPRFCLPVCENIGFNLAIRQSYRTAPRATDYSTKLNLSTYRILALSKVKREDETDTRRLIRVWIIDDRWGHIDRRRIVVVTGRLPIHAPAIPVPALIVVIPALIVVIPALIVVIPLAPIVIFAERRRDGYTADHRDKGKYHHNLAYCQTKLSCSRIRGFHSDLPLLE